ncbi:hypothetical protein, partial [Frankia sp. EI5c]|uniref:hypothetical protein n=1 Tax=Frankia sp. EI5c TaxID=683316 RepID=UPI001A7EF320
MSATAPRSTATSSTDGPRPGRLGEAIPYGAHDDTLFKYACLLRSRNVDKVEAYALIEQRRRDCQNGGPSEVAGFTAEAARAKVDEVWGRYPAGRGGDGDKPSGGKGPSQATQLVNLALERYDLGQTDEGEPFAVA